MINTRTKLLNKSDLIPITNMPCAASHSFNYIHILYKRDDCVYYAEDSATLPTPLDMEDGGYLCGLASHFMAVSMCQCLPLSNFHGFWRDMINYTNQDGERLFGKTWKDFMAFEFLPRQPKLFKNGKCLGNLTFV